MKLKTLFTLYSAAAIIICLNFLVVPGFWINLYGASADAQASFLFRLIAAPFGGLAVMAWVGRNAEPSKSRDAMVLGFAVANVLAAIVAVFIARTGVYNQFAWGPVATFALCAFAFLWVGRAGMSASAPN